MAAPNGASIFPLALITNPQPPEFMQDNLNQLLELIAVQCAPASGAALAGVSISSFAAGQIGTFVANGATPVTVANTTVTANSIIIPTLKTVGGTVGAIPAIKTITPGTGFTIAATASDTSTYNFVILS